MDYLLPKQISDKLQMSLKTVYNHLTKYSDKIETKRSDGKTFVNFVSFVSTLQNYKIKEGSIDWDSKEKKGWDDFVNLQNTLQTLQSDFEGVQSKKNNLEKYNNNLQEQITKYALILSDERNEKKDLIKKNDDLQGLYIGKVEELGKEKVNHTRKFYILLWLILALVVVITFGVFLRY